MIQFVDESMERMKAYVITTYEGLVGRKLADGDPVRLFLLTLATMLGQQRACINYGANMNLLQFAEGSYLDVLGVLVGTTRLPAAKATTKVKATLSKAQSAAVIIPAGTRVTDAGGNYFFALEAPLTISAGATSAEGLASCTTEGAAGNGYAAGTLATIVDPVPYVARIVNIAPTSGGADAEDDESYRARIQEAPERFSTAGPSGAYTYYTKQASAAIADVCVVSPTPGDVYVYPLLENGQIPEQGVLDTVAATLTDSRVRPLTDHVFVAKPTAVSYDVDVTYYIDSTDQVNANAIQAAVADAVDGFVAWQSAKLGRDVNPSELICRIMKAGAKRVEVNAPAFQVLEPTQVALAAAKAVKLGGVENE